MLLRYVLVLAALFIGLGNLFPVHNYSVGQSGISSRDGTGNSLDHPSVNELSDSMPKGQQEYLHNFESELGGVFSDAIGRMPVLRESSLTEDYDIFTRTVTLAQNAISPDAQYSDLIWAITWAHVFPPEQGDMRSEAERFYEFAFGLSRVAPTPLEVRLLIETDRQYRILYELPALNYDSYRWQHFEELAENEDVNPQSAFSEHSEQLQRRVVTFIREQAKASHAETRQIFVDLTSNDLSPTSRLLGVAIMALKHNPPPLAQKWCAIWEKEWGTLSSHIAGDPRTPAERLYAFVKATQLVPNKEAVDWINDFDRRFKTENRLL